MALAETPTLLSLDRFAAIMGINPFVFNSASGDCTTQCPSCSDVWMPYTYQSGGETTSIEALAYQIAEVEREFKAYLGCPVAPSWICGEYHVLETHYQKNAWWTNWTNGVLTPDRIVSHLVSAKTVTLKHKCIQEFGRRTLEPLDLSSAITYATTDADTFKDTATLIINDVDPDLEPCEVKVYLAGATTAQNEIRPLKAVDITDTTLTITISSLLLIDPILKQLLCKSQRNNPCDDGLVSSVDICDADSFLTTVDVYREYADNPAVEFVYTSESCGCGLEEACSLNYTDGCAYPVDPERGIIVPQVAELNTDTGLWETNCTTCSNQSPFAVKVWYKAGCREDCDDCFGNVCWEQAIAYMAASRFTSSACSCGTKQSNLFDWLRQDLALNRNKYDLREPFIRNPFGTRRGEVMAWRKLQDKISENVGGLAV